MAFDSFAHEINGDIYVFLRDFVYLLIFFFLLLLSNKFNEDLRQWQALVMAA